MIVDTSALTIILRDDFSLHGVPPKNRGPECLAKAAPLDSLNCFRAWNAGRKF
jgi:hypothetical protein